MPNQNSESTQLFAGAFAETLTEAITAATGSAWTVETVDKPVLSGRHGSPFHVRMTVEGSLRGECFVEFYRSELAPLVSGLLKKAPAAFDDEQAQALTKVIASAMPGMVACVSPEYGMISIQVDAANGLAQGAMRIVPLSASCEGTDAISILLYFGPQLIESLTPKAPSPVVLRETAPPADQRNLKLVMDVELNVTLRFGQRQLPLREVLELGSGSVIELDRQVDDPVELLLDGRVIARGEAVIVDGNYGLRITEVTHPVASQIFG